MLDQPPTLYSLGAGVSTPRAPPLPPSARYQQQYQGEQKKSNSSKKLS